MNSITVAQYPRHSLITIMHSAILNMTKTLPINKCAKTNKNSTIMRSKIDAP